MKRPVRLAWRSGTMGVKLDECAVCAKLTPHRLVRQFRWLEVGPLGLVPLGMRHGLECGDCWIFTPLPGRLVRRGAKSGRLPLPAWPRPLTGEAELAGARTPDLDRVVSGGGLDSGTFYLGAWAVVVAIIVGLAIQPSGSEGEYVHSTTCLVTVGLSQGQPVPTPPVTVSETLCVLPHNFEPLAKILLSSFGPSATVPPYSVAAAQATAACGAAFESAFGSPSPDGLVAVVTGADARDWARGDRFTWCAALDAKNPWRSSSLLR